MSEQNPRRDYRVWQPHEDRHLRDNWHRKDATIAQIGAMIGRGEEACKARSRSLALGPRPVPDRWPPGRFEMVRDLYLAGVGCLEIAERIGLTRNQVTSKLDRAGLLKRRGARLPKAERSPRAVRATTPRPAKPAKVSVPKGVMVLSPLKGGDVATPNRAANIEARANPSVAYLNRARAFLPMDGCEPVPFGHAGCKWPVGGDGADMVQCGAQRKGERPYCASHCEAAYVPLPPGSRNGKQLARSLRRWAA